jgi:gluconate 5-dehydrogenase
MSDELAGLAGIITGAASGIGRHLAEGFAAAGAEVALFDADGDGARAAAEALGEPAAAWTVDVTDEGGVSAATTEVQERFGRLDFLVNNAGVRHAEGFLEHDLGAWRRTLDVDLTGVFVCSQAAARIMARAGGGKILNIASIAAVLALRTRPAYVAAKAGVAGLTRAAALELGPLGIRVNAIGPGVIETPLTASYFEDEDLARLIRENVPLGRWGQTEDLLGPAIFLCGPAANYVSGQLLCVDGGWTAGKGY